MRMGRKNYDDITWKGQIFGMLGVHAYITLIAVVFGLVAFWWFLAQRTWNLVYSMIFTVVYFMVLYSKAWRTATYDKHPHVKTKSYPWKGLLLALGVVLSILFAWILMRMTWILPHDETKINIVGMVLNAVFVLWTYPFNGIQCVYQGGIHWYAHIIMYGVPILACTIGYFAGYHEVRITDKITPLFYEKKE